jgi:hypothetical protein
VESHPSRTLRRVLIPVDFWYIVPYEVIGGSNCSVHFTPEAKRQKYGEYREAWDLLRRTGMTIQACTDYKAENLGSEWGREQPVTVMLVSGA